jgi:hypothetical protein
MGSHVAWMKEMRNSYKFVVREPERKRPPGDLNLDYRAIILRPS